ncbi:hypothetical protein CRUP_004813 [Coryphaenoides rupestris]|nr:hypothetical protein CRUP_004813 [Coryphaenoides rupestris]
MASDGATGDHRGPKASSGCPRPLGSGGDQRTVDKTLKRLEKLHQLSTNPRLGLKNSPPYLPDLVSQTVRLLTQVWEPYRQAGAGALEPQGDEDEYLRVHVRHLLDKTERALLLFKEGRDKMYEETSNCRRNLTKLSLLFSHMLWELKELFPNGKFQGHSFRLTKTEAEEFWRRSFGKKCVVHWTALKKQLTAVHSFEEGMESMALKSTIDLTCNDHVSVVEFDIFTSYLYPDGREVNPDLTGLCEPVHRSRVKVTEEQYELYCEIGSTFQLCKICTERDKNTRIQPCGHLLCQHCLTGWQKSDGHTCPYCRCDIRETESIVIEGFRPGGGEEDDDEEEDDDDDHEDVELVMKEVAALKKQASQDPRLGLPPYPLVPGEVSPTKPPRHSRSLTSAGGASEQQGGDQRWPATT